MALKVWLPLNGSLENKGISDFLITSNTGATINNNGKIGKCYSFDGTDDWIQGNFDKTSYSGKPITIACWFKSDKNKAYGGIVDLAADLVVGYYYNSNGICFSSWRCYKNSSGTRTGSSNKISTYYNADIWHHIVVTFEAGIETFYVDGQLSEVFNHTNLYTTYWEPLLGSNYNKISIGKSAGDSYWTGGLVNDVRIYDHCLSPLEVKEISQGLILHYKLDRLEQSSDNFITGILAGGQTTVNNLIVTTSGENKDTYFRLQLKQPLTEGKIYKISCVGENIPNNSYWRFPIGGQGNSSLPFDIYEGYNEYTFIANSSCTSNPLMMDDSNRANVYMNQCVFKNFQLYECNTITDSSGYGNDGVITGNLMTETDSKRYLNSTVFNGSSNISLTNFYIGNEWSYGCWVYSPISSRGWEGIILLNNTGSDSDTQLGFYTNPTGKYIQNTANGQYNSRIPMTYGQWNHFFGTFDGSSLKTYFNGELVDTKAITANLLSKTNLTIGARSSNSGGASVSASVPFNGKLSDVRIYTTALSAEDITTLYHTPAQIDNLGGIHGFELEEKQGNMFAVSPLAGSLTWDSENNYYVITSQPNTSNWGIGPSVGVTPKKIIPWGYSYRLSYEVYSPTAATWLVDYNNNTIDVTLSGNDNDTGRIVTNVAVPANQWTLITLGCSNTNSTKNPDHLPLYDYSTGLGPVMSNQSNAITWYMRNPQWYLVDIDESTNFQVYENGVFKTNFLKEDNLNNFASFRKNEKATWGVNLIEK